MFVIHCNTLVLKFIVGPWEHLNLEQRRRWISAYELTSKILPLVPRLWTPSIHRGSTVVLEKLDSSNQVELNATIHADDRVYGEAKDINKQRSDRDRKSETSSPLN